MRPYPRPGILTLVGWISLIWSATSLVGVVLAVFFFVVLGAGSWLGGPAVGAVGSVIGILAIVGLLLGSILSLILFAAGLRTLRDDPSGVSLHRTWAWISIAFDFVALAASTGLWASSWWGLGYAIFVLYATSRPEVRLYLGEPILGPLGKPLASDDELF